MPKKLDLFFPFFGGIEVFDRVGISLVSKKLKYLHLFFIF